MSEKQLVRQKGEVFPKKDRKTPKKVIDACKRRFSEYDEATR